MHVTCTYRARDMKGKHERFWEQGDFGYVKKEVDSMMTLCKPKKKVSTNKHTNTNKQTNKV